jgi:hypothetical protein
MKRKLFEKTDGNTFKIDFKWDKQKEVILTLNTILQFETFSIHNL